MSRIIVDVTQLAHLTGKITGIPRVMDELAKRFKNMASETVIFVSWVKEQKEFYEIDYRQTIELRRGIAYVRSTAGENTQALTTPAGRAAPYKNLLRRVAKKGLSVGGKVSPRLAQKIETRAIQARMSGLSPIKFGKGDVLVIPWGEWWDTNFTQRVMDVRNEGAKLVQIIHDIGPTIWPNFFEQLEISPTTYNSKVVPVADLVLTVSHNTKKELTQWLRQQKLHVPKIEVFRLGDDLRVSKAKRPTDPHFIDSGLKGGDFLLCVGTIEAKKNHLLFYYVYKLAKARGIELPTLVMVGRRGYHSENAIDIMSLDPEVRDKFVFLFNTSDEELSWLYDHCMFTVLPSFHEGWGIPIAESVGRGVPCLCSNTSSMVEIAEGIVSHFSPASPDECLVGIQAWLDPKKLEAARQLTKKYKPFTWDQSFEQVASLITKLI